MTNPNPATPAQAANPGSNEQGTPNPSATTPAATNQGAQGTPEGKVTISTKEYADLQRAKARQLSFEKRAQFTKSRNNPQPANGDPNDPANDEIARLTSEKEDADRRALQAEIRGSVRDVLDREEFKALPKSTRELILKNPHMLSQANNLDEALLDIEDFVREQVAGLETPASAPANGGASSANPPGVETPPKIAAGVPSHTPNEGLEDTSNLRGVSLSRATLRNAIKQKKMGGK